MKTCFVSMPLGLKVDPFTGITIDFDNIYHELIAPAIFGTQYNFFRIDGVANSDMHRSIIESVISSDIMIVDLSTLNPNVLYELGMRHMAQRGLTIMICSIGTRLPFNIVNYRVINYELNSDGTVAEASKQSFRQLLKYSIESNLEQTVADSPVYQIYPDIKILLPDELTTSQSRHQLSTKTYKKKKKLNSSSSKEQAIKNIKEEEEDLLYNQEQADPIEFVNLLKSYRDVSAWKELVRSADTIPDDLKKTPEVSQLLALALNRLGEYEKAINIIENLIIQTGGDSESYSILGRIYKDRYEINKEIDYPIAKGYLESAILYYRRGFEKQRGDYYAGVNVINLLMQRRDSVSNIEIKQILPEVRESLENSTLEGIRDYWYYATSLELYCIAKEWENAEKDVQHILQLSTQSWMIQTTIGNLNILCSVLNDEDTYEIRKITSMLQQKNWFEEELKNA